VKSRLLTLTGLCAILIACGQSAPTQAAPDTLQPLASPLAPMQPKEAPAATPAPFDAVELTRFNEPWAMTFLPDGRLLVTEKQGVLKLHTLGAGTITVSGAPRVAYGGQGGFGDVVLHPGFADNGLIYLSYVEAGEGDTFGAAVARARLEFDASGAAALTGLAVIWRQVPKVSGRGHFGHRIAFAPDGHLFISSGERQHFDPAQDMGTNLGKIVRINDDGTVPTDNPFASQGGVAAQVWTLGHRNPLGLTFDGTGQLWNIEMGPMGGDELNKVERGANYGYPIVSNGDHYDGRDIPDHYTHPEFHAPAISWTPVISPGDVIFYSGDQFPTWKGNALAAGLSSKALIRIEINGDSAREVARYDMGQRIREVEQGPDGALYLLEDGGNARLLKLTPKA
jgi:aldose sugar dehydrogenase